MHIPLRYIIIIIIIIITSTGRLNFFHIFLFIYTIFFTVVYKYMDLYLYYLYYIQGEPWLLPYLKLSKMSGH